LLQKLQVSDGPAKELKAEDLESLWIDLGGDAALPAYRAACILAAAPDKALALLRERLVPASVTDLERIPPLLINLDHDQFPVREAASRELRELGPRAEPALRRALESKPSLEVRRRIDALLSHLETGQFSLTPGQLRQVRALGLLEQIGTKEARQLLEALAAGIPEAHLTQQAKASLERLNRRFTATP
jgi:hypothetical protein